MRIRDGGSKRAANLRIDSGLLDQAKAMQLNLSAIFERALHTELRQRQREQWLSQNADALDAYNAHVREHGVFSDGLRQF